MNKFNLTFSGKILPGKDPVQVKLRFGKMFGIDDPVRLERFFTGQTIILRRNLERKAAAQYFHELHLLGAVAALVKVTDDDTADAVASTPAAPPKNTPGESTVTPSTKGAKKTTKKLQLDTTDQVWAVSSQVSTQTPRTKKARQPARGTTEKTPDKSQQSTSDISACIRARKEESLRQAEQEATREKAEQVEQRRKTEEENARREVEKKQQAEADAARRKAQHEQEKAERARKKAEKAAQRKAALKEKKRLAAEEAARLQAAREEKQRKAAEEAARLKAEQEEKLRKAAEEAARLQAKQEEKQRKAAEEAARLKAEREEKLRREAEEAARLQAEQKEKQRKAAEEATRLKAEREEKLRREAEEAARLKAEREEKLRREAEEAARLQAELEEIKHLEDEEAARLQAELEEIKHQEAEELARIKADTKRKQVEAEQKSAERLRTAAGKRTAQDPQREQGKAAVAIQRPEPKPRNPQQTTLKSARASVKTSLETPRGNKSQTAEASSAIRRQRQPGEPNLYKLRPFRNTVEVRKRSELARQSKRRSYILGVIALAAMLITGGLFVQRTADPVITGASAIAIETRSGPALLTGGSLLFHDRAGIATGQVSLETLGLSSLQAPLAFDGTGALLAPGLLATDDADSATGLAPQLLRCDLKQSTCQRFSPEFVSSNLSAFVIHPMDGNVLLADSGQLVKLNRDGKVVARAAVTLPDHPVLRLHAGLLFINSAGGPGVGVYRYEDSAFGKQLDEILLLPPAAVQAEQSRVGDFLFSGGAWWASLFNPESDSISLYRFDDQWNTLSEITLPSSTGSLQLTRWGREDASE